MKTIIIEISENDLGVETKIDFPSDMSIFEVLGALRYHEKNLWIHMKNIEPKIKDARP
jgi:hypothetical protein